MAEQATVQAQDVFSVRSRVSWSALFAGVAAAVAVYVLLSTLGVALGLTLADDAGRDALTTGAGIWAILTALLALFTGGCVATRCTAGETKMEAVLYGVILWGVMFTLILWMTGSVLRTGADTLLGTSDAARTGRIDWGTVGRDAGLSQEQINRIRTTLPGTADLRAQAPEAAWWSVAGILLSMLASIGGALVGSGPTPLLRGIAIRRSVVQLGGGMQSPTR